MGFYVCRQFFRMNGFVKKATPRPENPPPDFPSWSSPKSIKWTAPCLFPISIFLLLRSRLTTPCSWIFPRMRVKSTAISNFAAHTIFHKTRKPLRDWFWAIFLVATRTTGSSANHTTLWSLLLGWGFGSFGLLHGIKSGLLLGPLVAVIFVFFHLLIALALSGKRD